MPYNPSQNYIGGQLLASGIGNLGEGLGKGISAAFAGAQKAKEEQSANQLIIDYAVKNNMITPEQHTEYLNGSASTKNGVVAGLTRTMAMDMQRQQEARLQQNADLQRRQGESELAFAPEKQRLEGNLLKGKAAEAYADAGGPGGTAGGAPITIPLTVKGPDGKDIALPGLYYTYRPGSKAGQVVQTAPGNELDIKTAPNGTQYYLDSKGNPKLLSPSDQAAARMNKLLREQAEKEGGVKPSQGGATPQGGTPAATTSPRQMSAVDQQAASWALANPDDPRAAAILKRLGL